MSNMNSRKKRHIRVRKKVSGSSERPRLCVFKSSRHICAQVIDDEKRITLVQASSLGKGIEGYKGYTGNLEAARLVGEIVAKKAVEKQIKKVVFDKGGWIYHGRVKALADAAREGGLEF
jgi:large subunit ribosomal protein L18